MTQDRGVRVEVDGATVAVDGAELLPPTSASIAPGSCTVVCGPNGSGKTTLLRLVAGLRAPSTGRVLLDGRTADERDADIRGAVSALIGPPATFHDLTLHDHVVLVDATWGRDPGTCTARVTTAMDELGLGEYASRFPHELSSGQAHLFHLALVLFRPARLLVLDEPEQRLDADRRNLLTARVAARRDAGTTVLMACHDDTMTRVLADDVIEPGHDG
ncbi:MAG: ABC transporter ATP-binding protein [Phycicoccus sp.]